MKYKHQLDNNFQFSSLRTVQNIAVSVCIVELLYICTAAAGGGGDGGGKGDVLYCGSAFTTKEYG